MVPLLLAAADLAAPPRLLTVTGDVRVRAEDDLNDISGAGVPRADRLRLRVRAHLNAALQPARDVRLLVRVRTATPGSQQNPNVTFADFGNNPNDLLRLTPDRYELVVGNSRATLRAGRMLFPFFTPNEYLWDAAIAPLGIAANASRGALRVTGGAFRLPVGLDHFAGSLYGGQALVDAKPGLLAASLYAFRPDRANSARLILLDNNGSRPYSVIALNGIVRRPLGSRTLALGLDLYRNLERYRGTTDPVTRTYRRARTGYVATIAWGDVARRGHAQLGYRYSNIEKLAVNASYAHIDLARFGTAAQGALSDLKGHDLFANYALSKHWLIGARAMFMRRISTPERGDRARLDVTYSF